LASSDAIYRKILIKQLFLFAANKQDTAWLKLLYYLFFRPYY